MNLQSLVQTKMESGGPVRVGLIGEGVFGSMFLSQVPTTVGLGVTVIADLSEDGEKSACRNVCWNNAQINAATFLDDGSALCARDDIDVVIEATGNPAAACFKQYGLPTDDTGRYASMYKPFQIIGLELGISVLNAALRGEPTGTTRAFRGDEIVITKKDLKQGERLDGEGGYTVWGKACPAEKSVALGALPIGLAHNVAVTTNVTTGEIITFANVDVDETSLAVKIRREAEALL